jgi:radical SAM superfamily enzyme YgiQ (UPF0313 family)
MRWDKAARRRLSGEQGAIFKDWGGRIPVALIYPNTYYLGMSNLGFQTIYGLLNSYDNIVCERVFWEEDRKSIESGRPLDDFAVLAFSISYELDYFNVVDILTSSTTPLYSADRGDAHPLVIAGGPCIIANPEPLSPFFDCFAIGEAEAILPAMVEALLEKSGKSRGSEKGIQGSRGELLRKLSSLHGVYVPSLHNGKPISRQWVRNIDDFATTSVILTPQTELGDIYLIEVARGCLWGCRFCLTGYLFRPFRFRSPKNLLSQAEKGLKYTKRIGLLGACVSDYPQIDELVSRLQQMGAEMSISSLRIRPLSRMALRGLVESGTQTISLAPEAGSERLRKIINKGVSENDIIEAIDRVIERPPKQIKLYFMIGLPSETEDDISEMIELTLSLKERIDRKRAGCHLTLTVEPFVPKAGTPFQWLPMTGVKILSHRLSILKNSLEPKGIAVRGESVAWATVQGVLSRGDRRLAPVLAGMEEKSLSSWRRSLAHFSLDANFYIGREIPVDEPLPWVNIHSGVELDYLKRELERAPSGEETPPCPLGEYIECHKCGVC